MTENWRTSGLLILLGSLVCGCGDGAKAKSGETCTAAAPCGGTLDGNWQLATSCVDGDLAAAIETQQRQPAECKGLVKSATINMSGTVTFAAGLETDQITRTFDLELLFTSECILQHGYAVVPLNEEVCSNLPTGLMFRDGYDSATCSLANGLCACAVSLESRSDPTPQDYTIAGNTIVYASDTGAMDYCVSGKTLTLFEVVAGIPNVKFRATANKLQ